MSDEIEFLRTLRDDLRQVAASERSGSPRRSRPARSAGLVVLSILAVGAVISGTIALTTQSGGHDKTLPNARTHVLPSHHPVLPPGPTLGGPAPIPYGPSLGGVAAVDAADIWAVGSTTTRSDFHPTSIALHYNGSTWTSVSVPNVGQLRGVAAISSNDVWTFGADVLRWDGHTWSRVAMPRVPGANFNAISAAGPDDVWIVGTRNVKIGPHHLGGATLAEHWNGTSWLVTSTPDPNPRFSDLIDVVTLSPTDAWIVGQAERGITMHWDGQSWQLVGLPQSLARRPQMWGVGTDGAGTVWAVGDGGGPGYGKQIYLRWDGHAWQIAPSPHSGEVTSPSAVSGTSATDLWAVGSAAGDRYMIARYDGHRWANTTADTPGVSSYQINLADVSTLSQSNAWAVGQAQGADQPQGATRPRTSAVILHWNGTAWRPVSIPGVASIRP